MPEAPDEPPADAAVRWRDWWWGWFDALDSTPGLLPAILAIPVIAITWLWLGPHLHNLMSP